jgi:hypothetical protein
MKKMLPRSEEKRSRIHPEISIQVKKGYCM